jgi:hypothetical protein
MASIKISAAVVAMSASFRSCCGGMRNLHAP